MSDPAVEAAAEALCLANDPQCEECVDMARTALTAARPLIEAEVRGAVVAECVGVLAEHQVAHADDGDLWCECGWMPEAGGDSDEQYAAHLAEWLGVQQ